MRHNSKPATLPAPINVGSKSAMIIAMTVICIRSTQTIRQQLIRAPHALVRNVDFNYDAVIRIEILVAYAEFGCFEFYATEPRFNLLVKLFSFF